MLLVHSLEGHEDLGLVGEVQRFELPKKPPAQTVQNSSTFVHGLQTEIRRCLLQTHWSLKAAGVLAYMLAPGMEAVNWEWTQYCFLDDASLSYVSCTWCSFRLRTSPQPQFSLGSSTSGHGL